MVVAEEALKGPIKISEAAWIQLQALFSANFYEVQYTFASARFLEIPVFCSRGIIYCTIAAKPLGLRQIQFGGSYPWRVQTEGRLSAS